MTTGPRIYNLFPLLAGTVQQWGEHVPRIAHMKFNWIYLNPFHYPGFSGSLYAIKDYYRPHNLLVNGEQNICKLIESFCQLAAEYDLSVIMDLVINHTSKDSLLVTQNPQWFRREADGSLYSPRAIDPADSRKITVWGDLAELDYQTFSTRESLISYFRNMISYFIDCGIRGFRCDAAYQIPADVWKQLIGFARSKNKDVIFLAETLGCRIEETQLLRSAGFDYIFNSAKWWDLKSAWLLDQYESFRHIAPSIAFPESHDTNRLVVDLLEQGITHKTLIERAYRLHYLRTAMFSTGVMIPMGYEFGFSRKLHVITTRQKDWEFPRFDLSSWITAVNQLKSVTRVLNIEGPQYLVHTRNPAVIGLVRRLNNNESSWIMTYINSDLLQSHEIEIQREGIDTDMNAYREVTPERTSITLHTGDTLTLTPGEARVFVNL